MTEQGASDDAAMPPVEPPEMRDWGIPNPPPLENPEPGEPPDEGCGSRSAKVVRHCEGPKSHDRVALGRGAAGRYAPDQAGLKNLMFAPQFKGSLENGWQRKG